MGEVFELNITNFLGVGGDNTSWCKHMAMQRCTRDRIQVSSVQGNMASLG